MRRITVHLTWLAVAAVVLASAPPRAGKPHDDTLRLPETALSEQQRVIHALNRLGFGPRPGDPERVRDLGLERWIELQLSPESIPEAGVGRRLGDLSTLTMTQTELLAQYPPPGFVRGLSRRLARPLGMKREEIEALFPEVRRLDDDRRDEGSRRESGRPRMIDGPGRIVVELSQAKLIRAVYSERQLQEVMTDFWFNHFNVFVAKGSDRWMTGAYERDAIRPHVLGSFRDLLGAVARHPAMLFYLDNWQSSAPGTSWRGPALEPYAAEAIREQGLPPGGLATLILQERGVDTGLLERRLARRDSRGRRGTPRRSFASADDAEARGLNENYARELLELHTLGVDGGYTQQDVIEVARCFTGWTLLPIHAGQGFVFVEEMHDRGKKTVLGQSIKGVKGVKGVKGARGVREGERVLDLLAAHPSTARFIATKLARRFVSDEPPQTLIDRMSATFLDRDGDIRAVLRTMIESPEFWNPAHVAAKVKTPFELVVSAVRATGGEIAGLPGARADTVTGAGSMMDESSFRSRSGPGLLAMLRRMDQPSYACQPPTGFPDRAEAWVSTGALLERMKFALGLAGDRIPGVRVALPESAHDRSSNELVLDLGRGVFGRSPNPDTERAIVAQLELGADDLRELGLPAGFARSRQGQARMTLGWLLASAEFQRR